MDDLIEAVTETMTERSYTMKHLLSHRSSRPAVFSVASLTMLLVPSIAHTSENVQFASQLIKPRTQIPSILSHFISFLISFLNFLRELPFIIAGFQGGLL